jgi:hypothetical protein
MNKHVSKKRVEIPECLIVIFFEREVLKLESIEELTITPSANTYYVVMKYGFFKI